MLLAHLDRIRELAEACLHLDLPHVPQHVDNLQRIQRNADQLTAALSQAQVPRASRPVPMPQLDINGNQIVGP